MYYAKKIGVFVSHIYGDYQQKLCHGIINKAKEYGMLTEIFTSNDGENLGEYGIGEQSILAIPKPENYTGIILASSTYRLPLLAEKLKELLQTRFTCPIIAIDQTDSIFPRIELENNKPIEKLVEHLAKDHRQKHICYLGDTTYSDFNEKRLAAYRQGMQNANLTIHEHDVASCNGSSESIQNAVTFLLSQEHQPEAVVCYNDTIAILLINELKSRGLSVPNDISVTGCDTLEYGQNTSPTLTSLTFPIEEIGQTAVEQIINSLHGESILPVYTIKAQPHIASSCGCKQTTIPNTSYSYQLAKRIEHLETYIITDMHMSANLQGVNDIDTGIDLLEQFVLTLPDCHEFYLCLYEDWDHTSSLIQELTMKEQDLLKESDTILLKLAIKDKERLPECTFTKRSILPDYLYKNSTGSYVFAPLFFGTKAFGYIALSHKSDTVGYSFSFISWLMNVNSMLKNICDKKNMGLLIGRLEDIYTKDEMTGLYNRHGFKLLSTPLVNDAIKNQFPIMAAVFDLDCLKTINDAFGHSEGNFAIQVLAHALESCVQSPELCARSGGDEFWVLGINYTNKKAAALIDRVNSYLNNYNRLQTKEYNIEVSSGFYIHCIQKIEELSELFDKADQHMYEEKKSKQKQILKST